MENSAENNFVEILVQLQNAGALRRLVLVGGWCLLVYKHAYDNAPEIPALRTTDINFLVREPNVSITKINIPDILERLGFEPLNDLASGNFFPISSKMAKQNPIGSKREVSEYC